MRRTLLAGALLAATPAVAQDIVCREKATTTLDYSQMKDVPGKVLECTHKPTGRTFYRPAGSGTPQKAPWETAAAAPARPSATPAKPQSATPALAQLQDCTAGHSTVRDLFRNAAPLPSRQSKTLSKAHLGTSYINHYSPVGLRVFGFPVEGLAHARSFEYDEELDDDVVVDLVIFGVARPREQVVAELLKTLSSVSLGTFRHKTRGGATFIMVKDDPAGSIITCEWWP
jgi:hypothetical protein